MKMPTVPHSAQGLLTSTFASAISRATLLDQPILAAVSFEIPYLDPLKVLRKWDDGSAPWFFWKTKDSEDRFLAWATAVEIEASGPLRFNLVTQQWREISKHAVAVGPLAPRLCGGFRFDTHSQRDAHWQSFADASLIAGECLFLNEAGKCFFMCQHMTYSDANALELAKIYTDKYLDAIANSSAHSIGCGSSGHALSSNEDGFSWKQKVEAAVQKIRDGHLKKVVLARTHTLPTTQICAANLLESLLQMNDDTFVYGCKRGNELLIGASPERLVRLDSGTLTTQALAGTTRRSQDSTEDAALAEQLISSEKERKEHSIVVEQIQKVLSTCCEHLKVPKEPVIRRLKQVQHLDTPISGRVLAPVGILDLVKELHPTPAVAGVPQIDAVNYIRAHENQDRGWYAAPLGWVDSSLEGDFLVALRCALLTTTESYLFAGCGIVEDSEPEREYEETNVKMWSMLNALSQFCPPPTP